MPGRITDYSPDADLDESPLCESEPDSSFDDIPTLAESMGYPIYAEQPVDVRWRKAVRLEKYDRKDHIDDERVLTAVHYLRTRRACRTAEDLAKLKAAYPDLDAAHALHTSDDKLHRGSLEGRLLTDQRIADVAIACDLSLDTVQAYHDYFFDVRSRLDQTIWLILNAIGPKYHHGLTEGDTDRILRKAAIMGGLSAFQRVQNYMVHGFKAPESLAAMGLDELRALRDRLDTRIVVLGWVSPADQLRRLGLYVQLLHELDTIIASRVAGFSDDALTVDQPIWHACLRAAESGKGITKAIAKFEAAKAAHAKAARKAQPGKVSEV